MKLNCPKDQGSMSRHRKNEGYTTYHIETFRALKPEYHTLSPHRLPWGGTFEAYETRTAYALNSVEGIGISIKGNAVDLFHIPSGRLLTSLNKRMTPDIDALFLAIEKTMKGLDWTGNYDTTQEKRHQAALRAMKRQVNKEYTLSLYYLPEA